MMKKLTIHLFHVCLCVTIATALFVSCGNNATDDAQPKNSNGGFPQRTSANRIGSGNNDFVAAARAVTPAVVHIKTMYENSQGPQGFFGDRYGRSEAPVMGSGGIIDLVLGILLISRLDITMLVLSFFVGFGVLFRSILSIGWSIELRRQKVKGWGALLAISILGLLFSFILLWNPAFAGLTVVYYTALSFVFVGVSYVYLSLLLRKLKKPDL